MRLKSRAFRVANVCRRLPFRPMCARSRVTGTGRSRCRHFSFVSIPGRPGCEITCVGYVTKRRRGMQGRVLGVMRG